jgi:3-methylcrotonyl-CoA carboxylase alpha subunit
MTPTSVTRLGPGTYAVDADGTTRLVYVAGSGHDVWAFSNGTVFHEEPVDRPSTGRRSPRSAMSALSAPMPATVVRVLVETGAAVTAGTPVIVLEAMKMEIPMRAPGDGVVTAIHCREGERVQAGAELIEFAPG